MSPRLSETHAGGVVRVKLPPGSWGALPHALLEDRRLALDSRAAAAWLATRPQGWQIAISHMLERLGMSQARWQRSAREMEAAGYLSRRRTVGEAGRFVWEIVFSPVPAMDKSSCSTIPRFSMNGESMNGSAMHGKQGDKKEDVEKEETPLKESGAETAPRAASRRALSGGGGGFVIDPQTGLHYDPRNTRDQQALREIGHFLPAQIAAAVEAARGSDPAGRAFPSCVLRSLKRTAAGDQRAGDIPAWARATPARAAPVQMGQAEVIEVIEDTQSWT